MTGEAIIICLVDNFRFGHGLLPLVSACVCGGCQSRNTHFGKPVLRQSVTLIIINKHEESNYRSSRPGVAANFKPIYYVEIPTPYLQTQRGTP